MSNIKNLNILGLSCFYHDSSAVLLCGNDIAAAQEERFTRKKFDNNFPVKSIQYCLKEGKIKAEEIDCVAFYEDPMVKLDRLFKTQTAYSPLSPIKNTKRIADWIENKYFIEDYISELMSGFGGQIHFFPHHLSHAASAFYPSPFSRAAILTVDGVGEWSSSSIAAGRGGGIEILLEQRFPHSLGLLYSAFTQYIGFKVDSGEYKLMGLAPYGNPAYLKIIKDNLVEIFDDGSIRINTAYFDYITGKRMINDKFSALFGCKPRLPQDPITQKDMDVACSIQRVAEEILLKMVKHAVKNTGEKDLCLAGGVALNCVANGKILRSGLIERLWVQPAAGDAGGALGAALLALHTVYEAPRKSNGTKDQQKGSFLGPAYSNGEIKRILDIYGFVYKEIIEEQWAEHIASLLSQGKVVGLFQGRMEYGPRALGSRSILGDPRDPNMQSRMNLKIKFRESFRPFAPIVLEEKAKEWFDINGESPYMLLTVDVKENKRLKLNKEQNSLWGIAKLNVPRSEIPAVTHVDYSARVQTVDMDRNKKLHTILTAFEKNTGCPVLINTSFNIRGEPIVCTPFDALRCFMNTNMDVLVLENFVLLKEEQGNILKEEGFKESFEPD